MGVQRLRKDDIYSQFYPVGQWKGGKQQRQLIRLFSMRVTKKLHELLTLVVADENRGDGEREST